MIVYFIQAVVKTNVDEHFTEGQIVKLLTWSKNSKTIKINTISDIDNKTHSIETDLINLIGLRINTKTFNAIHYYRIIKPVLSNVFYEDRGTAFTVLDEIKAFRKECSAN